MKNIIIFILVLINSSMLLAFQEKIEIPNFVDVKIESIDKIRVENHFNLNIKLKLNTFREKKVYMDIKFPKNIDNEDFNKKVVLKKDIEKTINIKCIAIDRVINENIYITLKLKDVKKSIKKLIKSSDKDKFTKKKFYKMAKKMKNEIEYSYSQTIFVDEFYSKLGFFDEFYTKKMIGYTTFYLMPISDKYVTKNIKEIIKSANSNIFKNSKIFNILSKNLKNVDKIYYKTLNSNLVLAHYYLIHKNYIKSESHFNMFFDLLKSYQFNVSNRVKLYGMNGYLVLNFLNAKGKKSLNKIKENIDNLSNPISKYLYYNYQIIF